MAAAAAAAAAKEKGGKKPKADAVKPADPDPHGEKLAQVRVLMQVCNLMSLLGGRVLPFYCTAVGVKLAMAASIEIRWSLISESQIRFLILKACRGDVRTAIKSWVFVMNDHEPDSSSGSIIDKF